MKLDNVKHTISFFSMSIAWTSMNVINSVYQVLIEGKAVDSGVVMFWSGLFVLIAWGVFIVFPLEVLDHARPIFKPRIMPFVGAVYGGLVYCLLIGLSIASLEGSQIFLPLALVTGALFGATYSLFIRSIWLIDLLYRKGYLRLLLISYPAVFLFLFLYVFPAIVPSIAFRFMPDEVRSSIVARTIPKFRVGDNFTAMKRSLPGYFDHIKDGQGSFSTSGEQFSFILEVRCGTIARLEYGDNQFDFDNTVVGNLENEPCP